MPEEEPEQTLPSAGKWLPGEEEFPSEEEIETRIEVAGEEATISPFDPDFILFALPLAFAIDTFDLGLEIAGYFIVIPKIIGIVVDGITLFILSGWYYWRTDKIAKNKRDYLTNLRGATQKSIKKLSKFQKIGRVSPEVFNRYMRLYGKQMGKIEKVAAKTIGKPLGKVAAKGGLTFLVEVFGIIMSLIPFWVIMVISALREK